MISRTISHYEILDRLGEGGMGTVYRAVDTRLDRPVAVKLLREESTASNENKKRFVQEAKAASALNHPHIVTIYDIGQDQGVHFIAMEYVVGASLAQLLARTKLSVNQALDTRCRSPMRWPPLTARGSFIAISSPPTSWSVTRGRSKSSISGWPS